VAFTAVMFHITVVWVVMPCSIAVSQSVGQLVGGSVGRWVGR
jgi:hypothetical protein